MIIVVAVLGVVSAALATVVVVRVCKDAAKEEKLDKVARVLKAGVDATIDRFADGKITLEEAFEIIRVMIDKAKE